MIVRGAGAQHANVHGFWHKFMINFMRSDMLCLVLCHQGSECLDRAGSGWNEFGKLQEVAMDGGLRKIKNRKNRHQGPV